MEWGSPTVFGRREYGRYRIIFKNKKEVVVPINQRNITHWLTEVKYHNPWEWRNYKYCWDSTLVWEGITNMGQLFNLQSFEWKNPFPEQPIENIVIEVNDKFLDMGISLLALTLVN